MSEESKRRQDLVNKVTNELRKRAGDGVNLTFLEKLHAYLSSPKKWELVEKIATPTAQVETQKFVICFDFLNDTECHYTEFDSAKGKALVALLKQITNCEVNAFPATRIVRDTVTNVAPYSSLFRKLSPDVTQLQEAEMGNGRIFFFIIGNKFNIVSIESNHR